MNNNGILGLDEMSKILQDRKLYVVAKETGVSYPTLRKIMKKSHGNFTLETLQKVNAYLVKPVV